MHTSSLNDTGFFFPFIKTNNKCLNALSRVSISFLSYPDEDFKPLQPLAVVLKEVLQFPNVLQQVSLRGGLARSHLDRLRLFRRPGHVLHQPLLALWRGLGMRNWKKTNNINKKGNRGARSEQILWCLAHLSNVKSLNWIPFAISHCQCGAGQGFDVVQCFQRITT